MKNLVKSFLSDLLRTFSNSILGCSRGRPNKAYYLVGSMQDKEPSLL